MGVDHFSSTLDLLKGYNVNLYVGEQIYKGKLIGVESDHVVIENENNYVFYYNINQIQAITRNTKQFQGEEITSDYLKTQSLREVLNSLTNSWVTIFCVSKQKFTGILSNVNTDYITLVNGAEGILIQFNNIANVIKGEIKENDNSESNEQENKTEAKNEELSYASPVMDVEESAAVTHKISDETALDVEPKQEADIEPENVKENATWSQPIKTQVSKQKEADTQLNKVQERKSEEPAAIEKGVENQPESSIKIIKEKETKEPLKVWSQSIKNAKEKLNENVTKKMDNELKKLREDQAQINKRQEKKKEKAVNVSKKDENPKMVKETKSKYAQKQEGEKTLNKAKEVILDKKNETKQPEQPIRAFRFLGEPISAREMSKPSIFDGWFNRNNDSRF